MAFESSGSDTLVICLLAVAGGFALGLYAGSCSGDSLGEKCRGRYLSLLNRPPGWTTDASRREEKDGVEYYISASAVPGRQDSAEFESAKREVLGSMRPLVCASTETYYDPCGKRTFLLLRCSMPPERAAL